MITTAEPKTKKLADRIVQLLMREGQSALVQRLVTDPTLLGQLLQHLRDAAQLIGSEVTTMNQADELLTACKQVMQRFPDAKIRRRPDDAIEIRSARFVGLVRSHGDVVVGHTQGREHRAQIKGSLEGAVRAVTLETPLSRLGAVRMVAATIRTRPIEGQSPLGHRFRAWRDRGYRARVGNTEFKAKSATELADWLVSKVGQRRAAKATGERVRAAPDQEIKTHLSVIQKRLVPALQQVIKEIEHSVALLEKDPAKYAPQLDNLTNAFNQASTLGRTGMRRVDVLKKRNK